MNGLLIPATIEGVSTRKDRTIRIIIGTQELTPEQAAGLMGFQNTLIAAYFAPKIDRDEMKLIDDLDPELAGKSQSERIRNVLYLLFKQDDEGFKEFNDYYHNKTEKYLTKLKSLIK